MECRTVLAILLRGYGCLNVEFEIADPPPASWPLLFVSRSLLPAIRQLVAPPTKERWSIKFRVEGPGPRHWARQLRRAHGWGWGKGYHQSSSLEQL